MSAAAGTHMQSVYWSNSYTFRQKEILCRIGKCRELSPGNRLSVCLHEIKAVRTTDPAVGTSCPIFCSGSRLLFLFSFSFFVLYWKIANLAVLSIEMLRKLRIYFVSNFKNLIKGFIVDAIYFSSAKVKPGNVAISQVIQIDLSRLIRHLILLEVRLGAFFPNLCRFLASVNAFRGVAGCSK